MIRAEVRHSIDRAIVRRRLIPARPIQARSMPDERSMLRLRICTVSHDETKPKRAAESLINLAKRDPKKLKRLMKLELLRRGPPREQHREASNTVSEPGSRDDATNCPIDVDNGSVCD